MECGILIQSLLLQSIDLTRWVYKLQIKEKKECLSLFNKSILNYLTLKAILSLEVSLLVYTI